jgi:hypothetical protein
MHRVELQGFAVPASKRKHVRKTKVPDEGKSIGKQKCKEYQSIAGRPSATGYLP